MLRITLLSCVFALAACTPPSGGPVLPGPDAGREAAADGGPEGLDGGPEGLDGGPEGLDGGPRPDAGPDPRLAWDLPTVDYTLPDAAPISASEGTWTFVPVPEAHCANGTATGLGVNLSRRSSRVLVFLAGGGACWEAAACAAGTAVHIQDTMGAGPVLAEAQGAGLGVLFDRTDPANPFRDASFVYVPYCTGDLHSGTRTHVYDWFGPRPLEHVGAKNMDAYLARLRPTFADADRVWLVGVSAGGLGTLFHGWRVQKAFPGARVDVFSDSGPGIDMAGDGRWATLSRHWAPDFPPGCPDCAGGLAASLRRSSELLGGARRLALASYRKDGTIANYFGLAGADVQLRLDALKVDKPLNLQTFFLDGAGHVVLARPAAATSAGETAGAWLRAFATDDPAWTSVGP
jgi:hypothetical protein